MHEGEGKAAGSFVWIPEGWGDGPSTDAPVRTMREQALCDAAQDYLDDHAPDSVRIVVFPCAKSQAAGIYRVDAGGLWIRYTAERQPPMMVSDLIARAWVAALEGGR
jgi:hypothetical protein